MKIDLTPQQVDTIVKKGGGTFRIETHFAALVPKSHRVTLQEVNPTGGFAIGQFGKTHHTVDFLLAYSAQGKGITIEYPYSPDDDFPYIGFMVVGNELEIDSVRIEKHRTIAISEGMRQHQRSIYDFKTRECLSLETAYSELAASRRMLDTVGERGL